MGASVQSWVVQIGVTVDGMPPPELLRRLADRVGPFGSEFGVIDPIAGRLEMIVRLHAIDAPSAAAVPLQRLGAELARVGHPVISVDAVEIVSAEESERRRAPEVPMVSARL
jgi:hypothetical protein